MAGDLPRPTPEGSLIRRVRSLAIPRLSIPAAAARIGMSAEQWGYVERGYYPARGGKPPRPFSPPAATLAKMAHALQVTPEQLESEGQRPDAAGILREITRSSPAPHAVPPPFPDRRYNGRRLAVWAEIRDADTGEPLYSFRVGGDASNGDTVTLVHRIGDVQASIS